MQTTVEGGLLSRIDNAVAAIRQKTSIKPKAGVILGTGLGQLVNKIKGGVKIAYGEIPHFPRTTVESHAGRLHIGDLSGRPVAMMEGRFHYYEGYSLEEVTFPVRVMKALGAGILIISNAAGGLSVKEYRKGDLVLIKDHINFMGVNPLIGPNDNRLGIRFPDMIEPYSERLRKVAHKAADKLKMKLHEGVYIGVTGPCLETRAEYRFMRSSGADLVGMSTVPEVIVGVHAQLEILGISVVTDLCDPDNLKPVDIEEIIRTANEAGPRLNDLVEETIRLL
ncbi:MAG: purine-nucleoside phosphorylase [Candidatus Omnitrophica bacterium]|nr:purine-nucleoside phosphorylase [Candidatus Omnitrophota bacterium]